MADGADLVQPAIIDKLRAAFDATTVLTGADIDARYHTDMAGIPVAPPLAVMRPRSTEEVSKFLKLCHAARVPVTTQGGMTGLVRATMPMPGEIVLSMERMTAIEEVDTGGGVVITQTGVPLQLLQERVGQDGFMFPLDLGARGSCTIGGNISTNAGGNRVIRYGMTRDLVLGLEAVLADGTILKGVRKYIKNNTGIDLKQLFVGTGIASALAALRPDVRVYAVQPETGAAVTAALEAGEPREAEFRPSFVDGAGAKVVLPAMWERARPLLAGAYTVTLDETAAAVRLLAERVRVIAEGAGALALAAALSGQVPGRRLVCIVSGGNIDAARLTTILRGETPV